MVTKHSLSEGVSGPVYFENCGTWKGRGIDDKDNIYRFLFHLYLRFSDAMFRDDEVVAGKVEVRRIL